MLALLGLTLGGCGVEWFPDQVSVTAFSFSPATVTEVAPGSIQTSNAVTVALIGDTAVIRVTGGLYSINDGDFTVEPGKVKNGDQVRVQHTAGSGLKQTVTTTLTIDDKSASFSSTTKAEGEALRFTPSVLFNVTPDTEQTSSELTLLLSGPTAISVEGGTYSLDGGSSFTAVAGTVENGDKVKVRHTSAPSAELNFEATVVTTLTVGTDRATFTTTPASVASATVDVSGPENAEKPITGQVTLHLVPGIYDIGVEAGWGTYSLNGAEGDYNFEITRNVSLKDGDVLHFQDPFASADEVAQTVFVIGEDVGGAVYGVPIIFNVTTIP